MQNLLSILFFIRKSKKTDASDATIYLRITYDGKRVELSTFRKIDIKKWNAKANKVRGTSDEAKQINRHLTIIKNQIYGIHQRFLETEDNISALRIKDEYLGNTDNKKSIIQLFEEHNKSMDRLVGREYSFRTLQRYETTKKHLTNFIYKTFKTQDYYISKIDVKFINAFIYFLKTEKNLSHNSSLKYLAYLKKIVRIAFANGWIEKDPFYNFKLKNQVVDKEYLTKDELIKIIEKKFSIPRVKKVRDIFVFCCYTGLAYSDVLKLKKEDIIKGIDGSNWIKINRTKTKTISKIPLLPLAEDMIKQYETTGTTNNSIFPVYSNQKMNGYLKEIADRCEIRKNLTFHMARHTFATTVTLSNGVPIESVSKMLGHRSLKTTQHYAKILDSKLSEDMNILRKRLSAK